MSPDALLEPSMTACPKCGETIRAGMARCRNCGQVLAVDSPQASSKNDISMMLDMAPDAAPGSSQSPTSSRSVSSPSPIRNPVSERVGVDLSKSAPAIDLGGSALLSGLESPSTLESAPVIKCECGRKLRLKPEQFGKKVKCPGCQKIIRVPSPEGTNSPGAKSGATGSASAVAVSNPRLSLTEAIQAAISTSPSVASPPANETLSRGKLAKLTAGLEKESLTSSEDAERRRKLIVELGESGDTRSVEALVGLLVDDWVVVREAATNALGKIKDVRSVPSLIRALSDQSIEVRRSALTALGTLGDARAITPILVLGLEEPQLRFASMEMVARIGVPSIPTLLQLLQNEDSGLRLQAVIVLGKIKDKDSLNPLISATSDPEEVVRVHAVEALGKLGLPEALSTLMGLADDANPSVRSAAAAGLLELSDRRSIPMLVRLLKDPEVSVRGPAVVALGRLKAKQGVPGLISLLQDDEYDIRMKAAEALGEIGDQTAVPELIAVSIDGRHLVRQRVATALGELKDNRATETLIGMLEDSEESVRLRAAESLGLIGDEKALEPLGLMLATGKTVEMRMAGAKGLGLIGNPKSLDSLQQALNDEFSVRCRVVIAIGQLKTTRALPSLFAMLKDSVAEIRYHAAIALGEIGEPKAKKALEDLLKKENDLMVRRGIAKALKQLGDPKAEEKIEISFGKKLQQSLRKFFSSLVPNSLAGSFDFGGSSPAKLALNAVMLLGILVGAYFGYLFIFGSGGGEVIRTGGARSVAISPDGSRFVIGREHGAIQFGSVSNRIITKTIAGHTNGTYVCTFSPDGSAVVTGGGDARVVVRDPQSGAETFILQGHKTEVRAARFSADASELATWSRDGMVVIWDWENGKDKALVQLPEGAVDAVDFTPDLKTIATGSDTGVVTLLLVSDGTPSGELKGLKGKVSSIAISSSGKLLAAAAGKSKILVWNLENRVQKPVELKGNNALITRMKFSKDDSILISCADNGSGILWTLEDGKSRELDQVLSRFDTIDFSDDLSAVIGGGADEEDDVTVWNGQDGQSEGSIKDPT